MERVVGEFSYYDSVEERVTLDREWTEQELKDDVYDETLHFLNGHNGKKGWLEKNKHRAFKDSRMTQVQYIVEDVCEKYDLIEEYNKALDKHRNDKPLKFGIVYFDEFIQKEVEKILKDNIIS